MDDRIQDLHTQQQKSSFAHSSTHADLERRLHKHPFERLLQSSRFARTAIEQMGYATLTAMIWPRWFAPYRLRLRYEKMILPRLHPDMQGYKLLFLTDLHTGSPRQDFLVRAVQQALAMKADAIVIGGDLIDYKRDALGLVSELMNMFEAPHGVYTIFGNHDYFEYSSRRVGERSHRRAIHKRLIRHIEQSPVRLLRNEMITLRRGGGAVQIVGMDELWSGLADPAQAFARVDPAHPVVCLQHNPDGYEILREYPWDYMLCGHSHGGQVRFPILGALHVPMANRQWCRGFYHFPAMESGRRTMFVSTGVGHSIPLRLNCPPEIVLFELVAE